MRIIFRFAENISPSIQIKLQNFKARTRLRKAAYIKNVVSFSAHKKKIISLHFPHIKNMRAHILYVDIIQTEPPDKNKFNSSFFLLSQAYNSQRSNYGNPVKIHAV